MSINPRYNPTNNIRVNGGIYIIWNEAYLEMAANGSITITDSADITQYKMDYGSYVGDNIVLKNKVFKFNGMVSNITSFLLDRNESYVDNDHLSGVTKKNQKLVPDYFSLLQSIRDSREVVTLAFDTQIDGGGMENCLIRDVTYTKEAKTGNAYMVDMTVEQIRISEAATFTQKRNMKTPDVNEKVTEGGVKPSQEEDLPPTSSLLLDLTPFDPSVIGGNKAKGGG